MSGRPRVLLVGRHFWPHGSIDSAGFLYQTAIGLHRYGVHVEVMTPRYASSWPEQLAIREIAVHRPAAAPRSDWSLGRYVRHLTGWLRERASSYDVMLADSIREESTAVVEAGRLTDCGTVLRFGGWGKHSDWSWWQRSRAARKCATVGRGADAVISKCAASHRALLGEGYLPSQIHRIDQGYSPGISPTRATRLAARKTLATVNRDLICNDDSMVLVCCGQMTRDSGVNMLAQSARTLVTRYPNLKLWLIGDGDHRDSIHGLLRSDGVKSFVAMPGSFCDLEDVFAAADVYVQTDEDGLDCFLPSAISAELPIVSLDTESTRSVLMGSAAHATGAGSSESGISEITSSVNWFVPDSPKSLRVVIREVLDDLAARRQRAANLRKTLLRSRPQSESLQQYVNLMQQIHEKKSSHDRQRPTSGPPRPLAGDSSVEAAT